MRLVDGIRERGFRKWYERELTRGHLRLLVLIGCAIVLLAMVELVGRRPPLFEQLFNVAVIAGCAVVGAKALRRYLFTLMHVEAAAAQATCPSCKTYGRLELRSEQPAPDRVAVACRGCRAEWIIDDVAEDA